MNLPYTWWTSSTDSGLVPHTLYLCHKLWLLTATFATLLCDSWKAFYRPTDQISVTVAKVSGSYTSWSLIMNQEWFSHTHRTCTPGFQLLQGPMTFRSTCSRKKRRYASTGGWCVWLLTCSVTKYGSPRELGVYSPGLGPQSLFLFEKYIADKHIGWEKTILILIITS